MIEYTKGDILEADTEAIVNTVNCVGVMGRGVALQFKHAYPANFKAYAAACERGEVEPGRMFVFDTGQLAPRWIINFPTKRHWRGKSRIEDIEAGTEAMLQEIENLGIRSIAVPPLGSGLGGLRWSDVRPIIESALSKVPDVRAVVFEPGARPETKRIKTAEPPNMTPGRAALIGLVRRYLAGMMNQSISLLEIHKLMYFLQVDGEPLRLRYAKALYGPYAENLRHVLQDIEGHFIEGYRAEGDAPTEQITLVPDAAGLADEFLASHASTKQHFDRVEELVEGFETPFGLELLATAHWVGHEEQAGTGERAVKTFYDWGPRKAQFTPDQVRLAFDRLTTLGWLPENSTPDPR